MVEDTQDQGHTDGEGLTVGEAAMRLGVTIRTLHHYDAIGLVTPAWRTEAGYRLYCQADVARLRQVVMYRRLGFGLDDIATLLEKPDGFERQMRDQRAVIERQIRNLHELVQAIDKILEPTMNPPSNDLNDLKSLFGNTFDDAYAREAEQRWGDTTQWAESASRTATYGKDDWIRIRNESDGINAVLASLMRTGQPATGGPAMDAAEQHRQHIARHFYDLDHAFHCRLAAMYVDDPRFAQSFDSIEPGLARYVRDAIHANADRARSGNAAT